MRRDGEFEREIKTGWKWSNHENICWIDGSTRRKHADGRVCTSIALAIFYKGAESRYLSCSSRCFPIRILSVGWREATEWLLVARRISSSSPWTSGDQP